ncbi:triacylglycerol lipase [Diatrype stigma]|uniref:Patatin-like phospholipase domain-containing protein n=1 Tax=Diatrype stigma TaxID=117547 RepID=A0AAN9UU37_9PEZI
MKSAVGKFIGRWTQKSQVDEWLDALHNAETYEDWEHAALQLDNLKGRNDPSSRSYDWILINERLNSIAAARAARDVGSLLDLVRSGLVRNLGNITAPRLYNRAFAGTKYLIEEYTAQVAGAIEDIDACAPTPIHGHGHAHADTDAKHQQQNDMYAQRQQQHVHRNTSTLSTQRKLDFLHDSRQAFGRSTLVLQGGAIFGLCHLGVIKALFLRGLLPRIITGTATGALIASLVSIHTEEELPNVLKGDGIDLSAFEAHDQQVHNNSSSRVGSFWSTTGWETLVRRVKRFWREGYFLDVKVLEECVKANVGDLTFEEAYNRSKRVLNITVATEGQEGVPTLLNYITAPNVLIWTAAVASNASTPSLYGSRQTTVLCKDADGQIVPWAPAEAFRAWTTHVSSSSEKDLRFKSPLARIAQLFNVNHFIVSQARPYLLPFLQSDMHGPTAPPSLLSRFFFFPFFSSPHHASGSGSMMSTQQLLFRVVGLELRHRLRQLDALGLLPASIRRFLVDEDVPTTSSATNVASGGGGGGATTTLLTLVPDVAPADFARLLLDTPARGEALDAWIRRGERSVWPAVAALTARCAVELELERAYQRARRLKAGGLRRKASTSAGAVVAGEGLGLGLGSGVGAGMVGGVVDRGVSGGGGGTMRYQLQQQAATTAATASAVDDDDRGDGIGPGVG